MKARNYTDGVKRTKIRIDYVLSLYDFSIYFTAGTTSYEPEKIIKEAEASSKEKIMKIIKRELQMYGDETPHYKIGDNNLDSAQEAVLEIFKTKFPELN